MLDVRYAKNVRKMMQIIKLLREVGKYDQVFEAILDKESIGRLESLRECLGPNLRDSGESPWYLCELIGLCGEAQRGFYSFESITDVTEEASEEEQKTAKRFNTYWYRITATDIYDPGRKRTVRLRGDMLREGVQEWELLERGRTITLDTEYDHARIYDEVELYCEDFSEKMLQAIKSEGYGVTGLFTAGDIVMLINGECYCDCFVQVTITKTQPKGVKQ